MFAKPSDYANSSYFKPAEHQNDLALLVEPKRIDRGVSNTYQGRTTLRDEVTADISVFANQRDLDDAKPSKVLKDTKIVHRMLTSTAERIIGQAMVAVVTKVATQNGSGYAFRDVAPEVEARVEAYYKARTEAADNAPDFD